MFRFICTKIESNKHKINISQIQINTTLLPVVIDKNKKEANVTINQNPLTYGTITILCVCVFVIFYFNQSCFKNRKMT